MKLDKLIRIKSDFDYGRANGLGYVSTLMQIAIFVKIFRLDRAWYLILIICGVFGTWILGFVLRKINFRKRESNIVNAENPMIVDIHKSIIK